MVIKTGDRSGELHAYINDKKYFLFSEQKDTFSDTNGGLLYFQRDNNKQVSGYTLEVNGEIFRKKD